MKMAKSAEDAPGQRRQAAAAPLRQLGDYQILREMGRASSDRQRNEPLRSAVRNAEANWNESGWLVVVRHCITSRPRTKMKWTIKSATS